jgi:hypothetical protein
MDRCIIAGIYGALLSLFINLFSPVYLYFLPSFLAAIFAIYTSRLRTSREGLVASLMTFLFGDALSNTLVAATYYLTNEPYMLTIDIWVVLSPILSALFAVLAGYVGVRLVGRTKPTREMPPSLPPPLPPV